MNNVVLCLIVDPTFRAVLFCPHRDIDLNIDKDVQLEYHDDAITIGASI